MISLGGLLAIIAAAVLILKAYIVLTIGKCKSKTRLDGKVVIVTGANSGERSEPLAVNFICSFRAKFNGAAKDSVSRFSPPFLRAHALI